MKRYIIATLALLIILPALAGHVEKVFTFSNIKVVQNGIYQSVTLDGTMLAGLAGEPMLPYQKIALMLPPGEKAVSLTVTGEELTPVEGLYDLFPQQHMQPLSKGPDGIFIRKEAVYRSTADYPATATGSLMTQYLNGYAFALSTFTPVVYNPSARRVSYYKKMTVHITTAPDPASAEALKNLTASEPALKRVRMFAQNPGMMDSYPAHGTLKTGYKILIITPSQYQPGFQDLVNYYNGKGLTTQVTTTESLASYSGQDMAEKIRNFVISEYQSNGIEHVILGGDAEIIPYRGFYCYVISGSGYEDGNIPADIYYSSLDGNWNANGNGKWGEPGEDDLLPEISVGRMSFSNTTELAHMVHKSVSYQGSPVAEEMKRPYLVSEFLYDPPLTWGSDYLELLVDDHSDNGYFTHGIPSAVNDITRLYDTAGYNWSVGQLLAGINSGISFIHHCGHANTNYMMRLYNWDITDQNFSQVNGVSHNYQLMYTHGCLDGAFDESDCIAELCTSISNFLVAGVFNSRYGWFDQGLTEGPSAHLHREFISALYHPSADSACAEIGSAHTMSKIMSAPWVGLPGEFEPGAQRWCHYDCNVLGDPALKIWTSNPVVGISHPGPVAPTCSVSPNPASGIFRVTLSSATHEKAAVALFDATGRNVFTRTFADAGAISIDAGNLRPGLYTCRIETAGTVFTAKLAVTR